MRIPGRRGLLKRLMLGLLAAALIGCLWLGSRAPPAVPDFADQSEVAPATPAAVAASFSANAKTGPGSNGTTGAAGLPNYRAHIFYYAWYGAPQQDGAWVHWNHPRLPHWNADTARAYSRAGHVPPDDIGANFYPELGPYSSANASVVRAHFGQIRRAGVGTVVVSWYPPGMADDNGRPVDGLIPMLLSIAMEFQLRLALHIEPYRDRNPVNLLRHLQYISATHARHPAFYRHRTPDGRSLPVHYVYDSYRIPRSLWRPLLTREGGASRSIRGGPHDALMFGLAMEAGDCDALKAAGFDGAYTYFAADGFTHASTRSNWAAMSRSCAAAGLAFAPSVGPGYVDTAVRPWNGANSRSRDGGRYYADGLRAALAVRPAFIGVTSYNEWHEGSQIEPAAPRHGYLDYAPRRRDFYLTLTAEYLKKYEHTVS